MAKHNEKIEEMKARMAGIKARQAELKDMEARIKAEKAKLWEYLAAAKETIKEEKAKAKKAREDEKAAKAQAKANKTRKPRGKTQEAPKESPREYENRIAREVADELVNLYNLNRLSTLSEIKAAMRKFNMANHPDVGGNATKCKIGNMYFAEIMRKAGKARPEYVKAA